MRKLKLESGLEELEGAAFVGNWAYFQKESEEVSTTGEIIWVYTNIENHQSEPIPEERKKQLTEPPTQ